jgi:drug/metabolite transporter (DMT)-like permease
MSIQKLQILPLIEASLVTFLWSTSYILIRIGLKEINPLAFAAYRYVIASLILLLPFLYQLKKGRINKLSPKSVGIFVLLGFTGFFIAQGLQFFGLYFLNSISVTFILNLTPIFVLGLSVFFLEERPSPLQLTGIVLTLSGVVVFFYSALQDIRMITGVLITLISGVGWAIYMIISRHYLGKNYENVITLTSISMFFGGLMLVSATVITGNIVNVSFNSWMIILWLSIVNTVVAFFLWNLALRTLTAVEQSILQNTMLIQITILAIFFLQETINAQKILGMAIVFIGVLIVQLRPKKRKATRNF